MSNVISGSRDGEFEGIGSVRGLKVVKSCSWRGQFIFTCSDTDVSFSHNTLHHREMDRCQNHNNSRLQYDGLKTAPTSEFGADKLSLSDDGTLDVERPSCEGDGDIRVTANNTDILYI